MQTIGVVLPEDVIEAAEREARRREALPSTEGQVSRSAVLREWVVMGHAVAEVLDDAPDLDIRGRRPRKHWSRQAALNQLRYERDDGSAPSGFDGDAGDAGDGNDAGDPETGG